MCYSAMIQQDLKKLAHKFHAQVDEQAFYELFRNRADAAEQALAGSSELPKITVAKALEWNFLEHPSGATAKKIQSEILRWRDLESKRLHDELTKQQDRVKQAEASLHKKTTKKAQNDLRIGTHKIQKTLSDLKDLNKKSSHETDSWIWPKYHFPGIVFTEKRLIRPFRYLIRPQGQPPTFDEKFNGAYNAQQERLREVYFWRELLGRHHGYMEVFRFKERQDEDLTNTKRLKIVKARKEFEFDPGHPIVVPFLWDHWHDPKKKFPDLLSAAAITCNPSPEILKQGIRRLLTPLRDENLEGWEHASRGELPTYQSLLADYNWNELSYKEVA